MYKSGRSDLIIPIMAFIVLGVLFLLFITFGFEDKGRAECIFPAEVDCISYQTSNESTDTLRIQLINNMHEDLNITYAEVLDSTCSYGIVTAFNGTRVWPENTVLWLSFHCKQISKKEEYLTVNLQVLTHIEPTPIRFTGRVKYFK